MTAPVPYVDGDGQAWFDESLQYDVVADPTGRAPSVRIREYAQTSAQTAGWREMSPTEARYLAGVLIDAADYAEGKS